MVSRLQNIGILAHVDAGKTTITENFIFLSGLTRQRGSVDDGSTATDYLALEKERGISIRSAGVSLVWKDGIINLIDTPGHVDFSAEVERVLRVLDGAIVVLSAVEGIQSHTISLVEALREMSIPFLFFVNKIDRDGANYEGVVTAIQEEFGLPTVPINIPQNEGNTNASVVNYWKDELPKEYLHFQEKVLETIVEKDDELMNKYLNEEVITKEELWASAENLIRSNHLIPVLTGVAKNEIGMKELLDATQEYLPQAQNKNTSPLSALVFKIEHDKANGRLAHIRVFEGEIKSKDTVVLHRTQEEIKLGVTKKIYLNKAEDIDVISAGNIGILTSANELQAGDILGNSAPVPKSKTLQDSVMTVQAKPKENKDHNTLHEALKILESEDPSLALTVYKKEQEFHLKMVGPMQIEILENQIKERFGIEVIFEEPTVIYKERPVKKAEGYVRYWMPKPCWAIMTFLIEPGEIGSGVHYESKVSQNDIHIKYQNEIERTIPKALKQGIKGWEVTDIKITLIAGEDHNVHSRPGDFALATPMGILKGLQESGTEFLEPILAFTIKAPEEHLGKIASDLTRMRARFANPEFQDNYFTLNGFVPAATSLDYSIKLSSLTSGKGRIYLKFHGYEPCEDKYGIIREYKGVNPLDEAQWILHMRGAYKADERG